MAKEKKTSDEIIGLLPHQYDFIADDYTPELLLCAGYGAGKSRSLVYKTLDLATKNIGYLSASVAPTGPMLRDVSIQNMEDILTEMGLQYNYRATPLPEIVITFPSGGKHRILFRSGENWRRLVSLNLAFVVIDEIDTMREQDADRLWKMAQSRIRAGNVFQLVGATTPEGFGWAYNNFGKQQFRHRRIIRARTEDNYFLPARYIESLKKNYPPHLIRAYMDGEFVNLNYGSVYNAYDRNLNRSLLTIKTAQEKNLTLHIGVDFNVLSLAGTGGMSAITHVKDEQGLPHAVDEIIGSRDTPALISAIKHRYPWANSIQIYPDSSGKNRTSKGAGVTDISLLHDAGFYCNYRSKNPLIRDRVNAMNSQFLNALGERRSKVNPETCPIYTEALEKQPWAKDGQPEKGKFDGPLDAAGYFIYYEYGIDVERGSALI